MSSTKRYLYVWVLLLVSSAVADVNFNRCLTDIQSGNYGVDGLLDNDGNPIPPNGKASDATAVTLELCYRACGRGSESFSFPTFAQESSAWLVPWLALLSQLPFGANDLFENANYIIMAVGSPTLIIYSLSLSAINTRWIGRLFDTAKRYPNRSYTARAFNALQHCCFYLEPSDVVLASIILLPQNDAWWEGLVKALEVRRHGWTISAFVNLMWVLIALILTIINALNSPNQDSNANGQSIGLLWLWLYPVVVGWIVLSPECDRQWLETQLLLAGSKAVIATDTPDQFDKCPQNKHPITLCKPGTPSFLKFPNDDIYRTLPIFDFARVYWLNQVVLDYFQSYHSVTEKAHAHGLVRGDGTIDNRHRSGTKDVIVSCCYRETPLEYQGDSVVGRILKASIAALVVQWGTTASGFLVIYFTPAKGLGCRSLCFLLYGLVSTVAWWCMVASAWLAQRSSAWPGPRPAVEITTKTLPHIDVPLIAIPMPMPVPHLPSYPPLTYPSSESCLLSETARANGNTALPNHDDGFAVWSRCFSRAGKTLAFLNALFLFGFCLAHLGNGFSNCWCNSSYIGLRSHAYMALVFPDSDFASLRTAWGGANFLGISISSLFAVLIIFAKKTHYPD